MVLLYLHCKVKNPYLLCLYSYAFPCFFSSWPLNWYGRLKWHLDPFLELMANLIFKFNSEILYFEVFFFWFSFFLILLLHATQYRPPLYYFQGRRAQRLGHLSYLSRNLKRSLAYVDSAETFQSLLTIQKI